MKYMGWESEFSTGIEIIDAQHKRIFQIINNLHEAILVENGPKILVFILDDLLEYAYYHFETEEPLLEKVDFSVVVSHKVIHVEIINKIVLIKEELLQGKKSLTLELVEDLRNWWFTHILEEDKKAFQKCN